MMFRFLLLCTVCFFTLAASAQHKVRFVFTQLPPYHKPSDSIYAAGSFNGWNPGHRSFSGTGRGIIIEVPAGSFSFKFTRGNWGKVEAVAGGKDVANRQISITKDTTVEVAIQEWTDHFPKKPKESTAGDNVHIVDTAFFIPQLNRYRRIWIYLPPSYKQGRKKYPVLYMHDGQNVFDAATSFSGEWGVDEAMDSLSPAHEMIVVAVDNGGAHRINEYCPYDTKYGKGEGDAYVDFLVQTLQPHIEKNYRVKKGAKNNFIAGSSLGGLISFYAILKYPNKFGGGGIFSPAFWINPQFQQLDPKRLKKLKCRLYFFVGQQEGEEMVPDMLRVFEQVRQYAKAEVQTVIRAEGTHSEGTWRNEFPGFVRWLNPLSP